MDISLFISIGDVKLLKWYVIFKGFSFLVYNFFKLLMIVIILIWGCIWKNFSLFVILYDFIIERLVFVVVN